MIVSYDQVFERFKHRSPLTKKTRKSMSVIQLHRKFVDLQIARRSSGRKDYDEAL